DDIRTLLRYGADKVSINSAAVSNREFVRQAAEKFGEQCIVVAIDAKRVKRAGGSERWEIFTHGGRNATGIDAVEYAREVVSLGAGEILLTSMDRDGTRQGFDIPLTRAISESVPVPVTASGGEASYTKKLLDKGAEHCAKKLGEEAVETVIAAIENDREHLVAESADLIYHLLVLLKSRGVRLEEVEAALAQRTSRSGLEE